MKLDETKNEGKLLLKIIDVLDDTANCLNEIVEDQNEIHLQLDDVDEDLSLLEDFVYEDWDEDDFDELDDDDFEYETIECPNCGEEICLDEAILSDDLDSLVCPNCNEQIEIEFDDDEDYDD